jgi:DNA-binding FadR family transcriptional regulator
MKRSSHSTSPERLADLLMERIFRGEYVPGTHLPAERQLAVSLGTDRTSLRMALKQLQRMNLVEAHHGSGVVVKDYRVHGGLDVLAALFTLEELPLEGSFIVEAVEFWIEVFGSMTAKALARMSLEDLRTIEHGLDRAVAAGTDEDAVQAELALQDALGELSGGVLFRMLNNSTRALRERIMRLLPSTVDMRAHLGELKQMLRATAAARPPEDLIRARLVLALRALTAPLRERLLFGEPPGAKRKKSIKERKR